ncbi:MAG: hypothetical protein IPP25_00245 [Saprospiraceae bacterium]|nr:hypothetical protein [Candidatus Opimibacter skivensis]
MIHLNQAAPRKRSSRCWRKAFAYASQTIDVMTEKDLNEKVEFIAGTMTRRRILLLMTDHLTHHRGQLVVYLRMKNVEPPKYVGW